MDRNNNVNIEQIAAMPAVRQAAQTGEELVGLWPLTSAAHMGNDAQYAENLQVRLSRTLAQVMTGEAVSMPDAEFVYEGAESIPGRPQSIVDALLAANDALDGLSEPETPQLLETARTLGIEWDEDWTANRSRGGSPRSSRCLTNSCMPHWTRWKRNWVAQRPRIAAVRRRIA